MPAVASGVGHLGDGMSYEICAKCKQPVEEWNEQRRRERFTAACHAMQSILTEEYSATMYDPAAFTAKRAVRYADELIKALGESE